MIVLDTNVLSEALKPSPSRTVLDWLASQEPLSVYVTAITQAELLYGIEVLPSGKRKSHLSVVITQLFAEDFSGRVLAFDGEAAAVFAKVVAGRKSGRRPISQFDAMIAAIARSRGAAVAARDASDFRDCGIRVVNPWLAGPESSRS
ncbi:MAG: type II toxin-antitoxin system VapC family toxin [Bryobacteraceae bacterium]